MHKRIYPPKLIKGIYFGGISLFEGVMIVVGVMISIAFLVYTKTIQFRIFVPVAIYGICCIRIDGEENIFKQLQLMFIFLLEQQNYISKRKEGKIEYEKRKTATTQIAKNT